MPTRVRLAMSLAGTVVLGMVATACFGASASSPSSSVLGTDVTATIPPAVTVAITVPVTPAPTEPPTEAPTTTIAKIPITRTLEQKMKGDDVALLQQRLTDLRFNPGPIDGSFGTKLTLAVWAYQSLVGLTGEQVDGKVTPEFWLTMLDPFVLTEQQPDGGRNHVEIDLPKQVLILWTDDQPSLITHISTGSNKDWCEKGTCGVAVTPPGAFKFDRRRSGWWESKLGLLYNPVYFNYGIAIHGALSVPNYPASHGCIRIPMHIADYFPSLVKKGDGVFVFDGVKPPTDYGAQPPPPNRPDPNAPPETEGVPAVVPTDETGNPVSTGPATTAKPGTTTTVKGATTTKPKAGATTTAPPATAAPTTKPEPPTTKAPATTAPPAGP